jgi:hypothetical protein
MCIHSSSFPRTSELRSHIPAPLSVYHVSECVSRKSRSSPHMLSSLVSSMGHTLVWPYGLSLYMCGACSLDPASLGVRLHPRPRA